MAPDQGHASATLDTTAWLQEWGVGDPQAHRGGLVKPQPSPAARDVTLLQRKPGKTGQSLGKTTGWIHRAALKMKNVQMVTGVNYEGIGPLPSGEGVGLAVSHGPDRQDAEVLAFDTLVLCTGQEPLRELLAPLQQAGVAAFT